MEEETLKSSVSNQPKTITRQQESCSVAKGRLPFTAIVIYYGNDACCRSSSGHIIQIDLYELVRVISRCSSGVLDVDLILPTRCVK